VTLRLSLEPPLARLLIDRAEKRNSITQAMWEQLPLLLAEVTGNPRVQVLLLQAAAPGAFSAGADIAEFGAHAHDRAWRDANQAAIRRAQHELARAEKPTIAMIGGACVGGGCGLAIACDLRVAGRQARFGITPARLGLVYSLHDTKLLVDLVGPAQAKRILFTGTLIDAGEAARIGLVDILADDPAAAALELAEAIAAASPHSVRASKKMIRRILDGQAEDDPDTIAQFNAAFDGEDYREGVAAFLAKRAPAFRRR
jgi:enoyl-CoA hydratase/carnithine racemase